jgi:hypothetical protein
LDDLWRALNKDHLSLPTCGLFSGSMGVMRLISTAVSPIPSLIMSSTTFSCSIVMPVCSAEDVDPQTIQRAMLGQPVAICWTPSIEKGRCLLMSFNENPLRCVVIANEKCSAWLATELDVHTSNHWKRAVHYKKIKAPTRQGQRRSSPHYVHRIEVLMVRYKICANANEYCSQTRRTIRHHHHQEDERKVANFNCDKDTAMV